MTAISRVILVIDTDAASSGTGFLLGPRLGVTAAHVVSGGVPHISVLTSREIEVLAPGQFRERSVPVESLTPVPGTDIALLEFANPFDVSSPARIVVTQPTQTRDLMVRVKGYASVLSHVDNSSSLYLPVLKQTQLVAGQMHGGGGRAFPLQLDLFVRPQDYKGMSGSVLTYVEEPLAIQTQAWPGPPAMVEFQRLDVLLGGAKEILSRHNIGTLTLPKEEPSLFIVEESEPAELDPLPVPIVAVPIEDIDTFRTRDFTL